MKAKRKTKADLEKEILRLNQDIRSLMGKNGATAKYTVEMAYNIIYTLEDVLWQGEPITKKDGKWMFESKGILKQIKT